jgi:hypothetical protein
MRLDASSYLDQTLTVINKLDAKDAGIAADAYYKTELRGVWSAKSVRTVLGTGDVIVATTVNMQFADTSHYMPYREWSKAADRESMWTLREGDHVVRGEVTEDISTATALKKAIAAHEPDAVQVKAMQDKTRETGLDYVDAGVMRYATGVFAEGA